MKEGTATLGGGLGELDICLGGRTFCVGLIEAASAPCVVDLTAFPAREASPFSSSDESESELEEEEEEDEEEDEEDEEEEEAISTSPEGLVGSSSDSLDEPDEEAEYEACLLLLFLGRFGAAASSLGGFILSDMVYRWSIGDRSIGEIFTG
jgi:hypothetical protein